MFIVPSASFVGLGIAAVSLLDGDALGPFLAIWCLAGVFLAERYELALRAAETAARDQDGLAVTNQVKRCLQCR